MRPMTLPLAAALLCLPFGAMAESTSDWLLPEVDLWTLAAGDDPSLIVTCPDAEGRLDFAVVPAWEEGYGTEDGGVFAGPFDKVSVEIGDKTFEAVEDPAAAATSDYGRVYTLPADADTVTAIMLGDNITVTLISDGQERSGTVDTTGAFDMFATTCAQINGL